MTSKIPLWIFFRIMERLERGNYAVIKDKFAEWEKISSNLDAQLCDLAKEDPKGFADQMLLQNAPIDPLTIGEQNLILKAANQELKSLKLKQRVSYNNDSLELSLEIIEFELWMQKFKKIKKINNL